MLTRRNCLAWLATLAAAPAWALRAEVAAQPAAVLNPGQSRVFRAWMTRLIEQQLRQGPTPRWQQRDCAGLVRFAVAEAFTSHDARWLRANGIAPRDLPPELTLSAPQQALRHAWRQPDGRVSAFATAQVVVQANSVRVGADLNQAQAGDLLFFDQGDEQHLMVWMGSYIAYHTGTVNAQDNGLRAVSLQQLMTWKDTRWRPHSNNPNFAGVYRLSFLTA